MGATGETERGGGGEGETARRREKDGRWLVAGGAAAALLALGCGAVAAPATLLPPTAWGRGLRVAGGAVAAAAALGLVVVNSPRLLYVTSLAVTLAKNRLYGQQHWNAMGDAAVVLGAIPLDNWGHLEALAEGLGVTAVVTLLEAHELEPSLAFRPVQARQWQAAGVAHLWLRTEDFEPVSPQALLAGADFIEEEVRRGGTVYVHCKAGRGRSSACVAVWLVKHRGMEADEAFAHIKAHRRQMHLNRRQRAAVLEAAALLRTPPSSTTASS